MRTHNKPSLDKQVYRNTANTVKKVNIVKHSMRGGIRF